MYFYYLIAFIFGLVVGSFLNVVIYRLNTGEPIINSRSHCIKCGHILKWYELVPVFSFLAQRGKCRTCRQNISWQYPLVEMGTGVIFTLIMINYPMTNDQSITNYLMTNIGFVNLFYLFSITCFLIVIFVYDLKHYIIPDKILYPAIGVVVLYRVVEFWILSHWNLIGHWQTLFAPLFSAILAFLFFLAIFLVTRGRGLGFGDVKFAFFMGLFLGWPSILAGLFLSWILGGIIGVGLLVTRKKGLKSQIPFGPFLVVGTFIAMLWGEELIEWYLDFINIT